MGQAFDYRMYLHLIYIAIAISDTPIASSLLSPRESGQIVHCIMHRSIKLAVKALRLNLNMFIEVKSGQRFFSLLRLIHFVHCDGSGAEKLVFRQVSHSITLWYVVLV